MLMVPARLPSWRAFLSLLLMAVVAGSSLLASGASAAPSGASGLAAGKVDYAKQAKSLATTLTRATTQKQREKALLAVMAAVHLPVVTGAGKTLVRGPRTLPRTFYLYREVDIRILADGLARHSQSGLAELIQALTAAGIKPGGQPVAAETLGAVLRAGITSAQTTSRDLRSLVPLLVRELGLRHQPRQDLAQPLQAEQVRLDPLQRLLLLADLILPRLTTGQSAATAALQPQRASNDACSGNFLSQIREALPFGKWAVALIEKVGPYGVMAGVGIDAIHGMIMAFSVRVTSSGSTTQTTHYGPGGHEGGLDAGKVLRYTVHVEFLDKLRDIVIKCGWLAGVTFPEQGPLSGIPIVWDMLGWRADLDRLKQHGTVSYDPADQKTDTQGNASLVFTPKDEKFPGFGSWHSDRGTLTGAALYQSALGNISVGAIAQFLTPKLVVMGWGVDWHAARGFKFEKLTYSWPGLDSFWEHSGHICGDDPIGKPWTWDWKGRAEQQSAQGTLPVTFPAYGAIVPLGGGDTRAQLVKSPRLQMNVIFGPTGGSAPVVEDESCPENSPSP